MKTELPDLLIDYKQCMEEMKELGMTAIFFGLSNQRDGVAINCDGEDYGQVLAFIISLQAYLTPQKTKKVIVIMYQNHQKL